MRLGCVEHTLKQRRRSRRCNGKAIASVGKRVSAAIRGAALQRLSEQTGQKFTAHHHRGNKHTRESHFQPRMSRGHGDNRTNT